MSRKAPVPPTPVPSNRRRYTKEFRREAVQMLLDGYTAASVSERLGLSGPNLLYRWKAEEINRCGPAASSLEDRVSNLKVSCSALPGSATC